MAEKTRAARKRKPGRPPKAATGSSAVNDLPPRDDLVTMYRDMLLIRRFEEKAGQLYGMGQIGGCLLYTSPSPRDLWISRMPSSA